jgi:hypothetical protein
MSKMCPFFHFNESVEANCVSALLQSILYVFNHVLDDIDGGRTGVSLKQPLQDPHQIITAVEANCVLPYSSYSNSNYVLDDIDGGRTGVSL